MGGSGDGKGRRWEGEGGEEGIGDEIGEGPFMGPFMPTTATQYFRTRMAVNSFKLPRRHPCETQLLCGTN